MSQQASEWLEKALALSDLERRLLVDGLVASLADESADEKAEAAWSEEVRYRVNAIRSGHHL
jgi:hypothetical protein